MRPKLQNKELTEAKAPIRGEHAKKTQKFSPKLKQIISLRLKESTFHSWLAKKLLKLIQQITAYQDSRWPNTSGNITTRSRWKWPSQLSFYWLSPPKEPSGDTYFVPSVIVRTIHISNVFCITKRLIPHIHLHTWWKACFDRESIGPFGISLQMERFEKFKAGCKRMLLNFGESLCKVWTIRIIGIIMSLLSPYQNILHN